MSECACYACGVREIPSNDPYDRPEPHTKLDTIERRKVASLISGPEGQVAELSVAIASDGALRRVNFWDLDNTLLHAHRVHMEAVVKIFPEVTDIEDLEKTYEDGWKLGNSCREWDRLHRIYRAGDVALRDPEEYRKRYLIDEDMRKRIDEPGHPERWYERAAGMRTAYDVVTSDILRDLYKDEPEFLKSEEFIMYGILHLLQVKTRLGELNVFMTANPRGLAEGLVRYSDLYKYGFAVASDEDTTGGGKELAILKLIGQIEAAGLKVPRDRLVAIGDSERGDVGSGFKLMQQGGYTFEGVLTRETMEEVEIFKAAAASDPDLSKMLSEMSVTAIANGDVPMRDGQYKLGRLGSAAAQGDYDSSSS